jgi:PAS domain S-box-containing protein
VRTLFDSSWKHYAVALAATGAALAVRWLLDPWLGPGNPALTLFGAIAVAVWFGGFGPALLAAVLGYVGANYLFIEPRGVFSLQAPVDWVLLAGYAMSSGLVIGLGGAMNAAHRRAGAAERELTGRVADLQASGEALREAKERVQIIMDTAPVAIAWTGADMKLRAANPIFTKWFGIDPARLPGLELEAVIGPDAMRETEPYARRVLAGEEVRYERLAKVAGGAERWIGVSLAPTGPEGRADGWVTIMIDLHERWLAEAKMRRAEQRKDEFLALLAHELRNPLAPIRNAVAILRRKDSLDPEVGWSRDLIDRQVEQLARLVEDLVDIERIAGGTLVLRKEHVALDGVVDMALETTRPEVVGAGRRLSVVMPAEPVWLYADPSRVAQALSILMKHSVRSMPAHEPVGLQAWTEGANVALAIDHGHAGMPPDEDIGFSMVRGIASLHEGTLEMIGADGRNQLVLRLPVAAVPASAEARPPRGALTGCRVLLADDNRDSVDSLQRVLEHLGCEVQVAYDGMTALAAAERVQPHVAVLDIGMPGMDGHQAARILRERYGAAVSLIALTGWGQEGDRQRALRAGFDHHLTKPVDPAALHDLLLEVTQNEKNTQRTGAARLAGGRAG